MRIPPLLTAIALLAAPLGAQSLPPAPPPADRVPPHDTFTVVARALGEPRSINVYTPPGYRASAGKRFPVLYMPDGGIVDEDFSHVVNTVDSLIALREIPPMLVVGIPNTQRRRDLTGPTRVHEDSAIAPRVGGSAAFRRFIREELVPAVNARYRTTAERAIVGESLAGLFVVETFVKDPTLFSRYVAFDPSLWWDRGSLVDSAAARLTTLDASPRTLYVAASRDADSLIAQLAARLRAAAPRGLTWQYEPRLDLTHATIFRGAGPAALAWALRPAGDSAGPAAAGRAWWHAFVVADTAYLRAHTAPALSLTLSSGHTFDRAAMLAEAATHASGGSVTTTWMDESVRLAAPGVALVTSRVTEGIGSVASAYRYLTVLERDRAGWRVVAAQTTRDLAFAPRVASASAGTLADFAGEYRTPKGGALRVVVRDTALVLIDPAGAETRLEPIGPGLFESPVASPGSGVLRFAFGRDSAGRVVALSRLNASGVATFPRAPSATRQATAPDGVMLSFERFADIFGHQLVTAFDSIPAARYGYRPTPSQQTIGYIAQHLEAANYGLCERFGALKHPRTAKDSLADTVKARWPKDTLVARLRASLRFCDDAIAGAGPLQSAALATSLLAFETDLAEHYSQLAVYMRLLGMVPPTALPPRKRTAIELPASALSPYVGVYEIAPGVEFHVTMQNGQLYIRSTTGGGAIRLWPESATDFFVNEADAQVTFTRDAGGGVTGFVLHQYGRDRPARKVR